jgi:hypothetical protein
MIGLDKQGGARPFLDLANIGSIIFDMPQGTTYMPNPTAMGEGFLYGNAVVMDDATAIETLKTAVVRQVQQEMPKDSLDSNAAVESLLKKEPEGFLYRETLILSEKPSISMNQGVPNGKAVLIARPKMDTQVFEVESDREAMLFVSGNYHPYWKAFVNDKPAKVYKAFTTFRAVEVPKGKSIVRLEYRSEPFHATLKLSLVVLIVFVLSAIALGVYRYKLKK